MLGVGGNTEDATVEGKRYPLKGKGYCPLFEGLTLAGPAPSPSRFSADGKPEEWAVAGIQCYLVPTGQGWVSTRSADDPQVCFAAWRTMAKGEVLFLASFERWSAPEALFQDSEIDSLDNKEATRRLIRWLAGKRDYPAPAPSEAGGKGPDRVPRGGPGVP